MSSKSKALKTEKAASLMKAFSERTGIEEKSDNSQRYLWTDALAVQNYFALFHLTHKTSYLNRAYK